MKFRTGFQDCQPGKSAKKCLFERHNRIAHVGFELQPC